MRRLLILVLFGLVLAGGAAVTWQAMGQAKLVEEDLTTARSLLARAGGFESGELKERLALVDQAERHTLSAQQRLGRWPLRQLGALPLVGRDVRVAKAVAASATGTVRATRRVVTALQPVQTHPPTRDSIQKAADALLGLHDTLRQDLERVRAARPAAHRRNQNPLPGGGRVGQRHRRTGRSGPQAGRRPVRPFGFGEVVPGLPEPGRAARHRRADRRVRHPRVEPGRPQARQGRPLRRA